MQKTFFSILLALSSLFQCVVAQTTSESLRTLTFELIDSSRHVPIPFATVKLYRYDQLMAVNTSDTNGVTTFYGMNLGRYEFSISVFGYETLDTILYYDGEILSHQLVLNPTVQIGIPIEMSYIVPGANVWGAYGYLNQKMSANQNYSAYISYPQPQKSSLSYYRPMVPTSAVMPVVSYVAMSSVSYYHNPFYCQYNHQDPWHFLDSIDEQRPTIELNLIEVNGKMGIVTSDGEEIVPPIYKGIRMIYNIEVYRFVVQQDDKFGVMNEKGEWVIPCEYDAIYSNAEMFSCRHSKHLLVVSKDGKFGLFTSSGVSLVPAEYELIILPHHGSELASHGGGCPAKTQLIRVKKNGKYGCINQSGKLVVPTEYDSIVAFGYSSYSVVSKEGKYGAIDRTGNLVLEPIYDKIIPQEFSGEMIVFKEGKAGVVGDSSEVLIPFEYDEIRIADAFNQVYFVKKNNVWGLINNHYEIVVAPMYNELKEMEYRPYIQFRKGSKWGFLTDSGTVVQQAKFDEIKEIGENEYAYRIGSKWGMIYNNATQTTKPLFDEIYFSDFYLFSVRNGSYYGVCNDTGAVIIKTQFTEPLNIYELVDYGYCTIEKAGKYGMVDATGEIIFKPIYDEPIYFSDYSRTEVSVTHSTRNGKPVVLNARGEEIIGPAYEDFYRQDFSNAYFIVVANEKYGIVDLEGNVICEPIYDEIVSEMTLQQNDSAHTCFVVQKGEKAGVIDLEGSVKIPFLYSRIAYFNDSLVSVSKNGLSALMTYDHRKIFDFVPYSYKYISGNLMVISDSTRRVGLMNFEGELLGPIAYTHLETVVEGKYFKVYNGVKEGMINAKGEVILMPVFANVKYYSPNFFAVKSGGAIGLYGFADSTGQIIVDFKYEKVKEVLDSFVVVRLNDKFGVVTTNGEEVIGTIYDQEISLYDLKANGCRSYSSGGKYGLINSDFEVILPPIYTRPINRITGDQFQIVDQSGFYGVIDSSYQEIIPCMYPYMTMLNQKVILVRVNDRYGLLLCTGEVLIPCEYDYISAFTYGNGFAIYHGYIVKQNGFYAVYDIWGKKLTNFIYDSWKNYYVEKYRAYFDIVSRDGKWFAIDGWMTETEIQLNP